MSEMNHTVGEAKVLAPEGAGAENAFGLVGPPKNYSMVLNHLILRDLNRAPEPTFFSLYSKKDIAKYLRNPARHEKQLRRAIMHIYGASSHFRRLVQYFVGLSDLAYIVGPSYRLNPKKANPRITEGSYRKVLKMISSMGLDTQLPKILTVCFREDVFYGTLWVTEDDITIVQLPSDFCAIEYVEGNVFNVSFNFSYFYGREYMLKSYPPEFEEKFELYKKDRRKRWIELDSPTSFAIKCNADILKYALPPFVGVLRDIYELEDYKQLKLTQALIENYAMIAMKLPMNDEGEWLLDYDKAKEFWVNLDSVLPGEIGSILTPMDLQKIGFERTHPGEDDTISNAEQNIFSSAGVSSMLFNNTKPSANALLLSIKADQAITFGIMKSIAAAINRFIQSQSYGKNFKITFLDVSWANRKEAGDAYLKAASYGLPTVAAYAATQGINQAELEAMSFLENDVLQLHDKFIPLQSSAHASSDNLNGNGATDEGGAPKKDIDELTDSGEQTAEDKDDWG